MIEWVRERWANRERESGNLFFLIWEKYLIFFIRGIEAHERLFESRKPSILTLLWLKHFFLFSFSVSPCFSCFSLATRVGFLKMWVFFSKNFSFNAALLCRTEKISRKYTETRATRPLHIEKYIENLRERKREKKNSKTWASLCCCLHLLSVSSLHNSHFISA